MSGSCSPATISVSVSTGSPRSMPCPRQDHAHRREHALHQEVRQPAADRPHRLQIVVFAVLLMVAYIVEEIAVGLFHGKTVAESFPKSEAAASSALLCVTAIMAVALAPFFAFREIARVVGEAEFRVLMLGAAREPGAGTMFAGGCGRAARSRAATAPMPALGGCGTRLTPTRSPRRRCWLSARRSPAPADPGRRRRARSGWCPRVWRLRPRGRVS